MSQTTSELRIFISSTFHDLQEEREYLIKRVFPGIRQLCRERGVELTEIDLRWGLTEEEATQGKVIRTCLEEIDRCRPYFIGVVGDRYGWSPKFHEVQKDAELVRLYPWIEDMSADGASILEMEFEYAVLRDPSHSIGSYFYFRKHPEGYDYETDEHKKLEALKKRTKASKRPTKEFATAAELGEFVRADLTRLIELHWHKEDSDNPLEIERASHEAFASTRRRSYILNPEYLKVFNAFIDGESQPAPLVVTGISGIGKSSLMAYLAHSYARRNPNSFVISHFIGASTSTSDHSGLLRHICLEIKDRLTLADEVPSTTEDLTREFPNWLAKIQDEKFIIFIDALNQLEGLSVNLNWLPGFLPPNIRIIVSTTEGESLEALEKLNAPKLILAPIDSDQREAIIVRFLGEFHKSLNQPEVRRIAQDEKTSVPLFLRTLLEELRLVGSFSQIDEQIDHYLSCNDTADLFRRVLERMEQDYGSGLVEEFMTLIWSARYGLSESELLALLEQPGIGPDNQPFTRLDLSLMLNALDFHLIRKDGLLNFFHNYLRDAVENRYLDTEEKKKAIHVRLGKYFSAEPAAKRRLDEEPWQWQSAEEWGRFNKCLTNIPVLERLLEEERLYQLIHYWITYREHFDIAAEYGVAIDAFKEVCDDEERLANIMQKLGKAFTMASIQNPAELLLRQAVDLRSKKHKPNDILLCEAFNDLATFYYSSGKLLEAESLFRKSLDIQGNEKGSLPKAKTLSNLGATLYARGKYDEAAKFSGKALDICLLLFGEIHSETASNYNNLGTIFTAKQEYDLALSYFIKALNIFKLLYGFYNQQTSACLTNIGLLNGYMGNYAEAEINLKLSLEIKQKLFGQNHEESARVLGNLGFILERKGDFTNSIIYLKTALSLRKQIFGNNHIDTINNQLTIGLVFMKMGKVKEADKIFDEYLGKQANILGEDHPSVKTVRQKREELSGNNSSLSI
ncbi:MAG TPA: tetratricopeptide repeat protein [Candidatus Kapabacteria bacterium]|nr:tetratricopeptide repeat protein [Candidatus Kapabacteria bacterium]